MRKLLLTLSALIVVVSFSFGQEVVIGTEDVLTSCGASLLDTGANPSTYSNNENITMTVCPEDGTVTNLYSPVFDLGSGDQLEVYDGDDTSAPLLGTFVGDDLQNQSLVASDTNPSGCLTLVFTSDAEDVGNFGFVVDCGPPCDRPISVINTDQEQPHRICPGESIDFSAENSVVADGFTLETYTWDFDDESDPVDGGETISHTFEETGIYFVQVSLVDDNGCTNGNRADFRVEVSNEPVFLADQESYSLCLGEEVEITNEAIPVIYVDPPGANLGGNLFIPDNQDLCFSSEIIFSGFDADAVVESVDDIDNFFINFEHSYMGDLTITFFCPNDQTLSVHQQGGGGTFLGEPVDNDGTPDAEGVGYDYFWAPDATNGTWSEESGGTLEPGTYSSVENFEELIGCPLNGAWTVEICDLFGSDNGFIFDWTVTIDPSRYPEAQTFTPSFGAGCDSTSWAADGDFIQSISDDCNTITLLAEAEGNYTYSYEATNNFGCTYTNEVQLEVFEPLDPGLNGQTLQCEAVSNLQLFDFLNGTPDAGGIWANSDEELVAGGLFNGNMGEGTYTYTTTGPGSCPPSSSEVQVDLADLGNPGSNNTLYICEESDQASLFDLLGDADPGGTWLNPDNDAFNGTFIPGTDPTGTYIYSVPSEEPCPNVTAEVLAVAVPSPIPSLEESYYYCGTPITIDGEITNSVAGVDYEYIWGPIDVTSGATSDSWTSGVLTDGQEITFTVSLADFPDCINTTTTDIIAPASPTVTEEPLEFELCFGESMTLSPPQQLGDWEFDYSWTFLNDIDTATVEFISTEPSVTTNNSGFYTLTMTGNDFCELNAIQEYLIIPEFCSIEVPNVFTPFRQDGMNDSFQIVGIDGFPGSRLVVYNRWGNIVYEDDNYNSGDYWKPKEEEVSEGTYFWVLNLNTNVLQENYSGTVTILR